MFADVVLDGVDPLNANVGWNGIRPEDVRHEGEAFTHDRNRCDLAVGEDGRMSCVGVAGGDTSDGIRSRIERAVCGEHYCLS